MKYLRYTAFQKHLFVFCGNDTANDNLYIGQSSLAKRSKQLWHY